MRTSSFLTASTKGSRTASIPWAWMTDTFTIVRRQMLSRVERSLGSRFPNV